MVHHITGNRAIISTLVSFQFFFFLKIEDFWNTKQIGLE